ncbi:hypothetical protein HOLleu_14946 [Holothuria leucospilota]|uniref:Uncharacterized protein n=1 Tax=Holothuria leucospilota TaxID=206669 RepID=A0A9Q1HCW9_HOLLE|nr:hypothetical protein HOLleu_14946 [Holothuria leucospilota]
MEELALYREHLEDQQESEAAVFLLLVHKRREIARRCYWVKPWIQRRSFFGDYENLMVELQREARGDLIGFLRMPPEMFHQLVDHLTPRLRKATTNFCSPSSRTQVGYLLTDHRFKLSKNLLNTRAPMNHVAP